LKTEVERKIYARCTYGSNKQPLTLRRTLTFPVRVYLTLKDLSHQRGWHLVAPRKISPAVASKSNYQFFPCYTLSNTLICSLLILYSDLHRKDWLWARVSEE